MRLVVTHCLAAVLFFITSAASVSAADLEAYPIRMTDNIGRGTMKGRQYSKKEKKSVYVQMTHYITPEASGKILKTAGPINGVAHGQILLKTAKESVTTAVKVGVLKSGDGTIFPAENILVRYGQYYYRSMGDLTNVYRWKKCIGGDPRYNKGKPDEYPKIDPDPTKGGLFRICPLLPEPKCTVEAGLARSAWLTFNIPSDTKPGIYKGTASVKGSAEIPLELEIVDAVLPDRLQSPMVNNVRVRWEHLAFGNGIPLEECWKSDRFWALVEAYLPKLVELRNPICQIGISSPSYVTTVASEGMVSWTKEGENWSWDFTALKRFLAIYKKVIGEPRYIEATAFRQINYFRVTPAFPVLYTDKATGEKAYVELSQSEPKHVEMVVNFVKKFREVLKEAGFTQTLTIGIYHDKMIASSGTDNFLDRILEVFPDIKLSGWSHGNRIGTKYTKHLALMNCKLAKTLDREKRAYIQTSNAFGGKIGIKAVNIGMGVLNASAANYHGMGFVEFNRWSGKRVPRGKFVYFKGAPFHHYGGHLVFPLYDGKEVVTSVDYEIFRVFSQDYELLELLRAKDPNDPLVTGLMGWLRQYTFIGGGAGLAYKEAPPEKQYRPELVKALEEKHLEILRAAGKAKIRGKVKRK
jgi:hypothetical protein